MKKKRVWIAGLLVVILAAVFTGCAQKKGEAEKKPETEAAKEAMGRYREESIDMPDAVREGKEVAYKLLKNPEGKLEVYTAERKENEIGKCYRHVREADAWSREEASWLNDGIVYSDFSYDKDGALYAIGRKDMTQDAAVVLSKIEEGKTVTDIALEGMESMGGAESPVKIEALGDGKLILGFYNHCAVYQDGKEYLNVESGSYEFAVMGNHLMVPNRKMDGVDIYDVDSKSKETASTLGMGAGFGAMAGDGEKNWYRCDEKGIHRLALNGSIWETVVDGKYNSLGAPKYRAESLLIGEEDDFYTLLQYGEGERDIKHYSYDAGLKTVPEKELSVVSLYENSTVRQAAADYQNANPETRIEYEVLMEQGGKNVEDALKSLNTRLLSADGPDILVLDGMPIASYVEKGVLMELDDIAKPLVTAGAFYENLLEAGKIGGKQYAVPARIGIPVVMGKKEAVEAASGIDKLAEYARTGAKAELLGKETYTAEELVRLLMAWYSDAYTNEDGMIDEAALTSFLEQAGIIAEQTKLAPANETAFDQRWGTEQHITQSMWLLEDFAECSFVIFQSVTDFYMPLAVLEKTGKTYSDIHQSYAPYGMMGINQAGGNKEAAADFLKIVLSEKIQKLDLQDGYPVNPIATEYWKNSKNDFYISVPGLDATRPTEEKMGEIMGMSGKLKEAAVSDHMLDQFIAEEAVLCLNGEKTAENAAAAAVAKARTYLME